MILEERLQLHVNFDNDEVVYRYVWRRGPRTRRQMRLAARRQPGGAPSFKKEWKSSWVPGIIVPMGYESFARARAQFLRSVRWENLVTTKDIFDLYQRCKPSTPG